jgi:hypothetical protein
MLTTLPRRIARIVYFCSVNAIKVSKKQLSMFEAEQNPQLKLELDGQLAAWSLKIQKITELLMKKDVSEQNRKVWLQELHYYQNLMRESIGD